MKTEAGSVLFLFLVVFLLQNFTTQTLRCLRLCLAGFLHPDMVIAEKLSRKTFVEKPHK